MRRILTGQEEKVKYYKIQDSGRGGCREQGRNIATLSSLTLQLFLGNPLTDADMFA